MKYLVPIKLQKNQIPQPRPYCEALMEMANGKVIPQIWLLNETS